MKWLNLCQILYKEDGGKLSQFLAVLTASIAIFTVGLHGGWTAPSLDKIMSPEYPHDLSEDEASYIAIIGPVGDVIGGILASSLVDILGRKRIILSVSIPQIFGLTMIYLSYHGKYFLYLARIFGGIGEGATLAILPLYIAEVSEPGIRGLLGTFLTITLMCGILFINILGSFVNIHTTALICLVFPVLFVLTFYSMPESPYYLLMKQKKEEAEWSLRILRRRKNVEKEVLSLTKDVDRQMSESGTYKDLFTIKSNRKAFMLASAARFFQQFSGCTAFAMYLQILLKEATDISPVIGSSLIILTQIVVGVFSSFFIDSFGRKPLLTFSSITCFLTLTTLAIFFTIRDYTEIDISFISWLPLLMMVLYTIFFASGLGVILNIFISEIFSTSIKSRALSLTSIVFASTMITSTKYYQFTADNFGLAVPYYSFSVMTFFAIFFFRFVLPETKGKTLEDIQQELKGRKRIASLS